MIWGTSFYRTTIGKKVVMALTGVLLFGFLIGHMLGNLKFFYGAEKFDEYAAFLREMGEPLLGHGQLLWVARIVLLAALVFHVLAAVQLWRHNRRSRPRAYARQEPVQADWASRTMMVSGPVLLVFIVYHLLHFTTGHVHPDFEHGQVHHNVVAGLSVWYVAAGYIVAMLALGWHLYHGVWSLFQTLGLNHRRYNHWRRWFAVVATALIVVGFITVPAAVLGGLAG